MKIRYLKEFITAIAFSFLLIGGLNQDIFGQGKGHGGGNRGGGGPPPGQQQRGGGGGNRGGGGQPQTRQQPQRPQPQARQMPQMRQQQPRQMPQMRQPQFRPQPLMRPQPQQQRAYRQPQMRQQPQQQQRVFRQPPGQMRRQEQRAQRQQPQFRPQPQQQQRAYRQPQQRQQQVFRQSPGQMRRQERAQRQERPQFQFRQMPQQRQERMSQGQARRQERQQQQTYNPGSVFQNDRGGRDRGNGGNGRGNREQLRMNRMNMSAPWYTTVGRVPPGQIRSAEVHERNAIRQAERADQRMFREGLRYAQPYYAPYASAPMFQYDRGYWDYGNYGNYYDYGYASPYYSTPYYPSYQYYVTQYVYPYDYIDGGYLAYSPLYLPNAYIYEPYTAYATYPFYGYGYAPAYYDDYYYGGFDWKSMLVRTLISFMLGSSPDNTYYGVEPYDPYYGYGYTQTVYSSDSYYDPYGGYGGYYPSSYQSVEYYQPVYSYSDYDMPLVDVIPMNDIFGPGYGGYSSVTYREVLTQGYEQGYQAGWYARENQLQDDWYESGYALNNDYVDPYAYSIGENRRCFSEGYALGYQDALSGRQDYYANYTGDTDLVSLLLSNVIGAV